MPVRLKALCLCQRFLHAMSMMVEGQDEDPLPQNIDIAVSAPSSPEVKSSPPNVHARRAHSDTDSDIVLAAVPLDSLAVPSGDNSPMPAPTDTTTPFEQELATANLPEPGPAFFEARRAIWRRPRGLRKPPADALHPRLRKLLESDGPIEDDEYWDTGIEKFYAALVSGRKLKDPLPLRHLVKTLQAGWIRDGTWPKGHAAPDLDDMTLDEGSAATPTPSASLTVSSGTSTPSTQQNRSRFMGFLR